MFHRVVLLIAGLSVVAGCGGSSETTTSTSTSTTATTTSGTTGTTTVTETGGTVGDENIVGEWWRPKAKGPMTLDVVLTTHSDESCLVELYKDSKMFEYMDCSYTADGLNFTIRDTGCGMAELGNYTYVIKEPVVTFAMVADPCKERADALPGDWTRL